MANNCQKNIICVVTYLEGFFFFLQTYDKGHKWWFLKLLLLMCVNLMADLRSLGSIVQISEK